MPAKKELEIDRRVGIALDALTPGERLVINELLRSPERFATLAADPANVGSIEDAEPQLFTLRVAPRLRLVYERTAEAFRVVDLVDPEMIGRFSEARSNEPGSPGPVNR